VEEGYGAKPDTPVFAGEGRYFRAKGDNVCPLTNFVVQPIEMLVTEDETQMTADLVTVKGEVFRVVFQTTDFSNLQRFKNLLNKRTIALSYTGSEGDLELLKRIVFPHTNSFYRVLSSETKSKQGFNVSGLIFDELFAQQTRELFDTMTKYTGDARRQPLNFLITTTGRDKTSICYEIHCKAKAVLDSNKIDPSFYPAVFGIEGGDDWNDEAVWRRVNPSIGVTLTGHFQNRCSQPHLMWLLRMLTRPEAISQLMNRNAFQRASSMTLPCTDAFLQRSTRTAPGSGTSCVSPQQFLPRNQPALLAVLIVLPRIVSPSVFAAKMAYLLVLLRIVFPSMRIFVCPVVLDWPPPDVVTCMMNCAPFPPYLNFSIYALPSTLLFLIVMPLANRPSR